jgi:hypothetical protein
LNEGLVAWATLDELQRLSVIKTLSRILSWRIGIFAFEVKDQLLTEESAELQIGSALSQCRRIERELFAMHCPPFGARVRVIDEPSDPLDADERTVLTAARDQLDVEGVFNACELSDLQVARALKALVARGCIGIDDTTLLPPPAY